MKTQDKTCSRRYDRTDMNVISKFIIDGCPYEVGMITNLSQGGANIVVDLADFDVLDCLSRFVGRSITVLKEVHGDTLPMEGKVCRTSANTFGIVFEGKRRSQAIAKLLIEQSHGRLDLLRCKKKLFATQVPNKDYTSLNPSRALKGRMAPQGNANGKGKIGDSAGKVAQGLRRFVTNSDRKKAERIQTECNKLPKEDHRNSLKQPRARANFTTTADSLIQGHSMSPATKKGSRALEINKVHENAKDEKSESSALLSDSSEWTLVPKEEGSQQWHQRGGRSGAGW